MFAHIAVLLLNLQVQEYANIAEALFILESSTGFSQILNLLTSISLMIWEE